MEKKRWNWKLLLRPALFTLGGAAAGYLYYYFVGCASGACPISANPIRSMIYVGLIGLLLSGVFSPCSGGSCKR